MEWRLGWNSRPDLGVARDTVARLRPVRRSQMRRFLERHPVLARETRRQLRAEVHRQRLELDQLRERLAAFVCADDRLTDDERPADDRRVGLRQYRSRDRDTVPVQALQHGELISRLL